MMLSAVWIGLYFVEVGYVHSDPASQKNSLLRATARRGRILDLEPIRRLLRSVVRTEPLRYDAFTAEHASVLEDDRTAVPKALITGSAEAASAANLGRASLEPQQKSRNAQAVAFRRPWVRFRGAGKNERRRARYSPSIDATAVASYGLPVDAT